MRIERRQHHRVRRVVDDEIHAGQVLERPDVPALASDDAPLEVIGGELHDGHGRLGGMARSYALEGVGDESAGPPPGVGSCLLLHLAHLTCELVPDEILRAVEQLLTCLVDSQPRDLLERVKRLMLRLPQLVLERLDVDFAIAQPLLAPLELCEPRIDLEVLLEDALLDLRDLDAAVLNLALDLAAERDGLLAGLDLRLAPDRLGVPLCVREKLVVLGTSAAQARPRPSVKDDPRSDCSEDDSDECCAGREHGASVGGCRCPRRLPRMLSPGRRPARSRPEGAGPITSGGARPPLVGRCAPGGLSDRGT